MFDIITIGSATQDIFIESDLGKILETRGPNFKDSLLCFEYGAKIEIDQLAFDVGGGSINTGVNFSNLGFNTAVIAKIGNDLNAEAVLNRLEEKNITDSLVIKTNEYMTGFSVILTSFEGDRTVLAHRGANRHILSDEIPWEEIKNAKWLYIAPLSGESNLVLDRLAEFAEENGVCMAFNPGSTQIKRGVEDLKKVLITAEVIIMNKSEASKITGITYREDSCGRDEDAGNLACKEIACELDAWGSDICKMLESLKSYGPKIVVITDGKNGVMAYDGKVFYQAPVFPAKVVSTLGAGDAFASTFVAGLTRYNWNIEKAVIMASINSAAIVQSFGAQSGLKTFDELEKMADQNKDFVVIKKENV